jgi:hypothetical protein
MREIFWRDLTDGFLLVGTINEIMKKYSILVNGNGLKRFDYRQLGCGGFLEPGSLTSA